MLGRAHHCLSLRLKTLELYKQFCCSMAVGEYISVSSQRDSEMADIEKERVEQAKGVLKALKRCMPCPGPCRVTRYISAPGSG